MPIGDKDTVIGGYGGVDSDASRVLKNKTLKHTTSGEDEDTYIDVNYNGIPDSFSKNSLQDYVDVTYTIRLSMVESPAGKAMTYNDLYDREFVTFASSGQANQRSATWGIEEQALITKRADPPPNSYFISDFRMKSVEGVSAPNPELAQVIEYSMNIHEPHGISLDYYIRRRAGVFMGYKTGPARVIWRIDVWWSGYDPGTGEWVERISFPNQYTGTSLDSATFFVNLIVLEANVTPTGTDYACTFVPAHQTPLRHEVIKLDSTTIRAEDHKFGSFLSTFQTEIEKQSKGVNGGDPVRYEFVLGSGAEELADQDFPIGEFVKKVQIRDKEIDSGFAVVIARDSSLLVMLRVALGLLKKVQEDLVREDDPQNERPSARYVIRPSLKIDSDAINDSTRDYKDIRYIFTIERFYDWRYTFEEDKYATDPDLIKKRINWILRLKALRRVYNYAWTPLNTEVISLNTKLKVWYYDNIYEWRANEGIQDASRTEETPKKKEEIRAAKDSEDASQPSKPFSSGGGSSLSGGYLGITGSMETFKRKTSSAGKHGDGDGSELKFKYDQEFENRITNDLLTLDGMEVIGDPIWLISKSLVHGIPDSHIRATNIIRIEAKAPDQTGYMNPDNPEADGDHAKSIGGFYEILTVEHNFKSDGTFTQNLSGYRLRGLG